MESIIKALELTAGFAVWQKKKMSPANTRKL